ncbi:PH domain-containing protein [Spongiactinospora rosea]|uniref:PH domain-containing protein n=1 Tax=Spongiactinospora rosea TaxID=2248750 RepID=UPI001313F9FF|nr:PH domain-containing protein [Spongiactinospora rosea]
MSEPLGTSLEWRVRRDFVVLKALGLLPAIALIVLNLDDRRAIILCGITALVLAVLVARDLLVPVRLSADPEGVVVARWFAGRQRVPWEAVERIAVDVRHRYGRRWEHLEIDTGETLFVLTSAQLGVSCTTVAADLRSLKSAARDSAQPDRAES